MISHQTIIQLVIAYTLLGAFVFTVIVTCLSLVGWIRFANAAQQKKLFYALVVELVVVCLGFFTGWLRFDARDISTDIQKEAVNEYVEVSREAGILGFYRRANDFLPRLNELIQEAKNEIWLTGVSFYITIPEHKNAFINKIKTGVRVRFLVYDCYSSTLAEVARGFSQTPSALRSECQTTMIGLQEMRDALAGSPHAEQLEIRLYSETPRARFYIFDRSNPAGKTFFISHVRGINSPELPGLLLSNQPGGIASLYFPSVEQLWQESKPIEEWIQEHPKALEEMQAAQENQSSVPEPLTSGDLGNPAPELSETPASGAPDPAGQTPPQTPAPTPPSGQ